MKLSQKYLLLLIMYALCACAGCKLHSDLSIGDLVYYGRTPATVTKIEADSLYELQSNGWTLHHIKRELITK